MKAAPAILVPRYMDAGNFNAQNLNAKAMLARFRSGAIWHSLHYADPDSAVQVSANVQLHRLWRGRLAFWHTALFYLCEADAIFYPGVDWFDLAGLRWRRRFRRRIPIIATLEGLAGTPEDAVELSAVARHPVFCQEVSPDTLARVQSLLRQADHIIAISPFLQRMGRWLYGDKVSCALLGVDRRIFHDRDRNPPSRFRVVCAANLQPGKQPELFVDLARRFPEADFVWFGGSGEPLERMCRMAQSLPNLRFSSPLAPSELAAEFRNAHLFVLPSKAEGVPKVTQEAAACGLPDIVFGYYETPTVVNGANGYVVWNAEELAVRVGELIRNAGRAAAMGMCGARMAEIWDWDTLAPAWESRILQAAGLGTGA